MIYCPQCGSGMTETTKFCKNCGLPLSQVLGYINSGGTSPLSSATTPPGNKSFIETLTPKQRLALLIALIVMSPAIFGTMYGVTDLDFFASLVGLSAVLIPIGILLAVIDYKNRVRALQPPPVYPQPYQPSVQPPVPQPYFQSPPPTMSPAQLPPAQTPTVSQQFAHPPTNPLAVPRHGSVTDDETQRLSERGN